MFYSPEIVPEGAIGTGKPKPSNGSQNRKVRTGHRHSIAKRLSLSKLTVPEFSIPYFFSLIGALVPPSLLRVTSRFARSKLERLRAFDPGR